MGVDESDKTAAGPAGGRPAAPRHEGLRGRGWYPWVVMGVVLSGSYLVVLNTTVLGVALPAIARDLGAASAAGVDWVITVYLLAVVAVQPVTAWVTSRAGDRAVYLACLSGFAVASALCAVAPTLPTLLAARFAQGAAGGMLMPLGMAMVVSVFPPHRRGAALGVWGMAVMAGPALGPPIGGLIVTQASWRWIFAALVPIAVIAALLAARLLREDGRRQVRALDGGGWLLAFAGIGLVVVGARQAGSWGYDSPAAIGLVLLGAVLLAGLVRRSWLRPEPILEVRLLTVPIFGVSIAMVWLITTVQYARLNFLPVELQVLRDLSAQDVGLILAPAALAVAATMPLGGWLADRVGARLPTLAGLSLMGVSMWQLAHLTPATPVGWIVAALVCQGVGTGLMRIPLNVAGINALPNRFITQAATLRSLNRHVAGALGTAVLAGIVVAQLGAIAPDPGSAAEVAAAQAAYNRIYMVAFGLVLAALCGGLLMPGRRRMRELQANRADEYREDSAGTR